MINLDKQLSYLTDEFGMEEIKAIEKAIQEQIELIYFTEVNKDEPWYRIVRNEIFLSLMSLFYKREMMNLNVEEFINDVKEYIAIINQELQERILQDNH